MYPGGLVPEKDCNRPAVQFLPLLAIRGPSEQEQEQEQEQPQESQPNPTGSISPSTANLILATPTKSQVGRRQQEDNIDNRGMSAEAEVAINRFLIFSQLKAIPN